MAKPENPVLMGIVGAPHGIGGDVRVKTFTADPLALGDYGTLYDREGRPFDIVDLRPSKNVVVARFAQVKDRTAAEALNGVELFVGRAQLPDEELEEDEFFVADLVGLTALDDSGARTGEVIAVHNFGAGDLLEIAPPGTDGRPARKQAFLVEFSRQTVPEIDFGAGTLVLVRPGEVEARGDEESGA